LLGLELGGDVLHHQPRASDAGILAEGERFGLDEEGDVAEAVAAAVADAEGDVVGDLGSEFFGEVEGVLDAVITTHFEKIARLVGLLTREKLAGGFVHETDLAVPIEDEDGVLDLVEEGVLEFALFALGVAEEVGLRKGVREDATELIERWDVSEARQLNGPIGRSGTESLRQIADASFQPKIAERIPSGNGGAKEDEIRRVQSGLLSVKR